MTFKSYIREIFLLTLLWAGIQPMHAQASGAARLLGHFVPPTGGSYVSGCWGWTDTTTGREYALLGSRSGTSIVEITDPADPVERAFVPGPTSQWRELQTWEHYAYVVSEGGGGTQIIDLSPLPDSVHLVRSFIYTDGANSTARAHTAHVREGYLYLNGCAFYGGGGVLIFSLADPEFPAFMSQYTSGHYIHDCFVRNDTLYAAAITGIGVEIVDVSDKAYPNYLATVFYPESGTHNCAVTNDGGYLLTTDEVGLTEKTLKIWDLSTPGSYAKVAEYTGDASAIVHNVFVRDTLAIMSYYTAGVKIVNISDPRNPVEVGGYDTCPDSLGSGASYTGAWSVYPFFPSGRIIVGDMVSGLFIIDLGGGVSAAADTPPLPREVSLDQNYPNPFNPSTTIVFTLNARREVHLAVYDALGTPVATLVNDTKGPGSFLVDWNGATGDGRPCASGVYYCRLTSGEETRVRPLLLLR